jgi:hypothetical protein
MDTWGRIDVNVWVDHQVEEMARGEYDSTIGAQDVIKLGAQQNKVGLLA